VRLCSPLLLDSEIKSDDPCYFALISVGKMATSIKDISAHASTIHRRLSTEVSEIKLCQHGNSRVARVSISAALHVP